MRTLLAATLLLLAPHLFAAPVPPPPKLTAELLVGTWHYRYGGYPDGRITFFRDGTYQSHHSGERPTHVGHWHVDGDTLVLLEYHVNPETGIVSGGWPCEYRFPLSTADYPTIAGGSVVMSEPIR
jgi:hypothetical protein